MSPASLNIAGCALSGGTVTCNGTGFPTNNTQGIDISNGFSNDVTVYNAIGKVDFNVNQNNRISGMYFFGNNSGTVEDFPELQSKWRSKIHTRAQVVGGSWAWTPSPRWVNEARFGYNRLYQPTLPGDLNTSRRPPTGSTPASRVHSRADCRASASADISFPAWVASNGQSSRDLTPSRRSSIMFLARQAATRSSSVAKYITTRLRTPRTGTRGAALPF